MNRTLRNTLLAATVTLSPLMAAACGSDDGDANDPSGTGDGSETTVAGEHGDEHDDEHDDEAARITFQSPSNGDRIAGGVDLTMVAEGIEIEPAGEVREGAGHFHVIADAGCVEPGAPIPKDADHVHFGSGAGAGTVYLGPGSHTLCLQVGDGQHAALGFTDIVGIEVGVTTREEFCDVVAEVDALGDSAPDDDFAATQAVAANSARLIAQLQAGTSYVDAEVRDDITAFLDFSAALFLGVAAAESEAAAEALWAELAPAPTDMERIEATALPWINETCGVALD